MFNFGKSMVCLWQVYGIPWQWRLLNRWVPPPRGRWELNWSPEGALHGSGKGINGDLMVIYDDSW